MRRAVEMEKASSAMFDDKEAVECSKRECRNRKEVEGGYHFAMVVQEREPAFGFAVVPSALELLEIAGDGRFGDLEADMKQLAVDTWCSQPGLSALMRRMSRRTSVLTLGRPAGRDFQRQNRRKPARCQDTTVRA